MNNNDVVIISDNDNIDNNNNYNNNIEIIDIEYLNNNNINENDLYYKIDFKEFKTIFKQHINITKFKNNQYINFNNNNIPQELLDNYILINIVLYFIKNNSSKICYEIDYKNGIITYIDKNYNKLNYLVKCSIDYNKPILIKHNCKFDKLIIIDIFNLYDNEIFNIYSFNISSNSNGWLNSYNTDNKNKKKIKYNNDKYIRISLNILRNNFKYNMKIHKNKTIDTLIND